MPSYYQNSSFRHHKRLFRKLFYKVLVFTLTVLIVGITLFYITWRGRRPATSPDPPISELTEQYQASKETFSTQYFQLKANLSWKQVQNETTANKFVYRSLKDSLIEHELVVSINDGNSTTPVATTHILPVEIGLNRQIVADKVSDRCRKSLPSNNQKSEAMVTVNEVLFLCNPDDVSYIVAVGLKGAAAPMQLTRPSGKVTTYGIIYRNLTTNPDDKELQEILNTFQLR